MERSGFIVGLVRRLLIGPPLYYVWMAVLTTIALTGIYAYSKQLHMGLIATGMQSYVSWGLYIGNFTFLVGVAAAAVLLIIPAYLYEFGPIKEIVIVGEALAVSALSMCLMFVTADLGRPDRIWHLIPGLGILNLPRSMLGWDIVVLNGYLFLNLSIPGYLLYKAYNDKPVNMRFIWPFILLSIPWAVSIHTVTAFIYNGLVARPFWNASILAPRFLASAFCSGPALVILLYQIVRRFTNFHVKNEALFKIAEFIAVAMAINLFLLAAEFFKELYSDTHHLSPLEYLYLGLHGKGRLVPWIWTAFAFNVIAFVIFLIPQTRKNFATLNLGCVLIIVGIWIEKGMGLIIPGFIPAPLGEVWEYVPTTIEVLVSMGIWSIGLLILTAILKVIIPIELGEFTRKGGAVALAAVAAVAIFLAPLTVMGEEQPPGAGDMRSLLKELKSSDGGVAAQAARNIVSKAPASPEVVAALAQAIKHPNEMVRLTVIEALSEIGPDAAPAVPALAEALSDKDPLVREAATLALFAVGKSATSAIPSLVERLADENNAVRSGAILALAGLGNEALPALLRALGSKDERMAAASAQALGRMGPPVVPELIAVLKRGDSPAARASCKALAEIGPAAVEPLIDLLKTGKPDVAKLAGETLEAIGSPAVPELVKAILDKR